MFPPWGDILPAQPEVLADVDVGGSKAPTVSIVCSTGRKSVDGMSVKETVPNTSLLQSFLGEERSCSHTSATAAGTQIRLKRLAQTLRSASLGPRSSLVQVHLLPFSGYKGEVAFSCVLGESRWWNVLTHTYSEYGWGIRWININYVSREQRPFLPLVEITAGKAQIDSIRKHRIPEGHKKKMKLCRKSVHAEATEWAGDLNHSPAWIRAKENRQQYTRHYGRFGG